MTEAYAFQAEINELLSLIIHTFYSSKDIFIRELLSNSSDALDKTYEQSSDHKIEIIIDKNEKTLTVIDNGIGMTKEHLIKNLGTIAKSGTKQYIESLKREDTDMIGQFGVGFYAAYLVANKVVVRTKHEDDQQYIWRSKADGKFTIAKDTTPDICRGTQVVLYMKDDEFLDEFKIKGMVKKYAEYLKYPIMLEGEQINYQKAIWVRNSNEVSEEEHEEFYKNMTKESEKYIAKIQFAVEGNLEFRSVLYIPKRAPFNMFENSAKKLKNVQLYVRKVFITDDCEYMIPEYLSFIRGIVDSNDLPLNISRETLQQSTVLQIIKKQVTKKAIEMMKELSKNEERYTEFYKEYYRCIKLGVYEDDTNRLKLADLLRFTSTKKEFTSFKEYKNQMGSGQEYIYYIAGENINSLRESPFIESLVKENYEVLFMTDVIDEYAMQQLDEYEGVKIKNAATIENKQEETIDKETERLCKKLKSILGERVESVIPSERIKESPCVLVSNENSMTANMERIIKAQALSSSSLSLKSRKSLEINPNHVIMKKLKDEEDIEEMVEFLYDIARMTSGYVIENPNQMGHRIYRMFSKALHAK